MAVRKTSLAIDEEKLAEARKALGTTGIRDTVDAALDEVVRQRLIKRHLARLAEISESLGDDPDSLRRDSWREF